MGTEDLTLEIAIATLDLTGTLIDRAIDRLRSDQWHARPSPQSRHALWLVGHVTLARQVLAAVLKGAPEPRGGLFAAGAAILADGEYPPPVSVAAAWHETRTAVDDVVRSVSAADLDGPSPAGVPTFNWRLSGALAASVFDEVYHVGQLAYVARWLGHPPLLGR